MNAAWGRLVVMSVLVVASGTAWGAAYELSTNYIISISGRDSLLNNVAPIAFNESDMDDTISSIGTSRDGGTDLGTATIRASAFAAIGTDTPAVAGPSLGVQVAGSVQILRPLSTAGGVLEAAGSAKATLMETLTFVTPGNTNLLRVEGNFNLTGLLSIETLESGFSMFSSANSAIRVSSNMFSTVFRELRSDSFTTPDLAARDLIPFVLTANPNGALTVDISLEAFGRAVVNGNSFTVPGVGFGSADFDTSFAHTLTWGGITSVTDAATGAPIVDWSVISGSGFDYSQSFPLPEPVPVPPALANMIAGLGVAGWMSRRRAKAKTRRTHGTPG